MQHGRELREHGRLALALLGLGGAAAGARGQLADHDRVSEVDGEREPVLAVGERERVHRLEEEQVEREHARDRDGDRVGACPRQPRSAARRRGRGRPGSGPATTEVEVAIATVTTATASADAPTPATRRLVTPQVLLSAGSAGGAERLSAKRTGGGGLGKPGG